MKWLWFWEAKFVSPTKDRAYAVASTEGFSTPVIAQMYFMRACEEGYLVAQGIPAGSVCSHIEYVLKEAPNG